MGFSPPLEQLRSEGQVVEGEVVLAHRVDQPRRRKVLLGRDPPSCAVLVQSTLVRPNQALVALSAGFRLRRGSRLHVAHQPLLQGSLCTADDWQVFLFEPSQSLEVLAPPLQAVLAPDLFNDRQGQLFGLMAREGAPPKQLHSPGLDVVLEELNEWLTDGVVLEEGPACHEEVEEGDEGGVV